MTALAAHRAEVFGRCAPTTGIKPFGRLVAQGMAISPYRDARHVSFGSKIDPASTILRPAA